MNTEKNVILITGSSGLIGSALIRRLAGEYALVGFDREGPPHPPPAAECISVDLASDDSVREGLARVRQAYGSNILSVIHLAAYFDFSGEPSPKYEQITVRGTERLLRGLQEFRVEQFLFSSTMLVHAPCEPGQHINEDWPLEPKWDYPKSKVETEELIRAKHGEIPVVLLRIAGVYDDRCHSIPLAHQIQRIFERKLVGHVFPGHIAHGQSFVHLDDLVDALRLAVERRRQLPADLPLLIGEPEPVSYDELQHQFGRLIHGEEWDTREIPKSVAKAGAWLQDQVPGEDPFIKPWMIDLADDHFALDITRARTLLGWEPKRSLRETLPKMTSALKTDPLTWYREHKLEAPGWMEEVTAKGKETPMPRADSSSKKHHEQRPSKTEAHEGMSAQEHESMLLEQHKQYLWTHWTNIFLGIWLISSPFTLGYSGGGMIGSDLLSGLLVLLFGSLALARQVWAAWAVCFVGIWLLFAPLVFWTPSAAAYLNGTVVGSLLIVLSVLIPGMPGMGWMEMPGPETPPGWSYNPSTWLQRGPIIALAFIGFFISRYLAAYQLGHIPAAWDPFFGDSTEKVLTSEVSKAWPISDAGLGAVAYMLEALSGYMGDNRRWRTMPWMVLLFALLVVPLGAISIILVILQPVSIGVWCTLCLVAAVAMLIMVSPAVDEVIAMGQFMIEACREGKPFWRTFWMGGTLEGATEDPRPSRSAIPPSKIATAMGLTTVPWTLLLSTVLGIWLMVAPAILQIDGPAADSDYLAGALVITFAVIAIGEVARPVRVLNTLVGAWLLAAPWLLSGATSASQWNDMLVGVILIFSSIPRGEIRERYGSWDRYIL